MSGRYLNHEAHRLDRRQRVAVYPVGRSVAESVAFRMAISLSSCSIMRASGSLLVGNAKIGQCLVHGPGAVVLFE